MIDTIMAIEKTQGADVDDRAMIDPSAKIGPRVQIGPWSRIGPHVEIGADTVIGTHVVIESHTRIGERNHIHSFACLGGDPQDLSYRGESTWLEIGNENVIREYVTLNRGSASGVGVTRIGNHNNILAYSHVAHDCQIGNHVLFVNHATTAGHVTVEDHAIMGAFTAVHQFCRIGAYSFLSRATEISKDVPPFMLVKGIPGYPCGLNLVGLKRHGFSIEAIRALKEAYKILYLRRMKFDEAKRLLIELAVSTPEVQNILDFINRSNRGIARKSLELEE